MSIVKSVAAQNHAGMYSPPAKENHFLTNTTLEATCHSTLTVMPIWR